MQLAAVRDVASRYLVQEKLGALQKSGQCGRCPELSDLASRLMNMVWDMVSQRARGG